VQLSSASEAEKRWRSSSLEEISGRQFRTGVGEDAEPPLLEAVAREHLVKTQQAPRGLAGTVVICELRILAVAL
jgi:hypothetical protein